MELSGINGMSSLAQPEKPRAPQEEFLKMLVAQLEHQDPLNPQSGADFVAQLAQFATLEQITVGNDRLEEIATMQVSAQNAAMAQLIGQQVTVGGDSVSVAASGDAHLQVSLAESAPPGTVEFVVVDEAGRDVAHLPSQGGTCSWDLQNDGGARVVEGRYRIVARTVGQEDARELSTRVSGEVDAVDYSGPVASLRIGGVRVAPGDVQTVEQRSRISQQGERHVGF